MLSGILGSLLGFGGSVVPAITDHFRQKNEQKFELKKMEKMAELRPQVLTTRLKCMNRWGQIKNISDSSTMTLVLTKEKVLLQDYRSQSDQ